MFRPCTVKFVSTPAKAYCGLLMQTGDEYTIEDIERVKWTSNSSVEASILSGNLLVKDGETWLTDTQRALDILNNVPEPGYGQGSFASSETLFETTATSFQRKLRLTTDTLEEGAKYLVRWYYEWGFSSISSSFMARVLVDGQVVSEHTQEPKDPNAAQSTPASGFYVYTATAGAKDIDIEYCCDSNGKTARIKRARIYMERI